MEDINFNEFSQKERHEIITAFLIKMRDANSMPSAERFYEYYFKKFYKMPIKLLNDIVYCQRTLKSHLIVYEKVVRVFAQQEDANPDIKNKYLRELEDVVYELNAECQYLVLRLQDDIDQFCLAFTEQQLRPNEAFINAVVSSAIVPLIGAGHLTIHPYYVQKRCTDQDLLLKYFAKIPNERKRQQNKMTPLVPNNNSKDQGTPLLKTCNDITRDKLKKTKPNAKDALQVEASRLNLQQALKRARNRNQKHQNDDKRNEYSNAESNVKSSFLQTLGLCKQDN